MAKPFKLRTTLIIPFVLQTLAAVGVVGYLSFRNSQDSIENLTDQLTTEVNDRVTQHLDQYLSAPVTINRLNQQAQESQQLDLGNFERMGQLFWQQLQVFNVGYINYANTSGEFIGVERSDDQTFTLYETLKADLSNFRIFELSESGDRTTLSEEFDPNDIRDEAWYQVAQVAQKPVWSEIYQWQDQPEILSISASYPLFNAQQDFLGVIGVDLILSQISQFLNKIEISPSAELFIVELDGALVAHSEEQAPYQLIEGAPKRIQAFDSQKPLLKQAMAALAAKHSNLELIKSPEIIQFDVEGDRHFLKLTPWRDDLGLEWLVLTTVPESDFMGQVYENTRNTIVLTLAALGLVIFIGIITARRIAFPILRLTEAANDMADGHLEKRVDEKSQIAEINTLAQSFNSMTGQLQDSFETLEEKVQERTAELAQANDQITELNTKLKAENLRMGAELDIARQIQQMILPRAEELESIQGLDISGYMKPAEEVGGDYYDVLETDGIVTLGIGDVTGHGLESGLLMLMTQTAVRTLQEIREANPVKFLDTLNRTLYQNVQRMQSDRNLTLAIINYVDHQVSLSGQHEEMIVVRANGELERIDTVDLGLPIGLDDDITDFIAHTTVDLETGDGIVLYTDGIPEAFNLQKMQYGMERFCDVIVNNWSKTAAQITEAIVADVTEFIGQQKVFDDITLLILKQQ